MLGWGAGIAMFQLLAGLVVQNAEELANQHCQLVPKQELVLIEALESLNALDFIVALASSKKF
eukprot:1158942-Pelagomonas_calceolata.AAC.3